MHPSSKPQKPQQRNITPNFLKFKRTILSTQASPKAANPTIRASKPNMAKKVAPKPAGAASKSAKKEYSTSANSVTIWLSLEKNQIVKKEGSVEPIRKRKEGLEVTSSRRNSQTKR